MQNLDRSAKIIEILRRTYPHHITIDPYELKPRPEKVRGCSSWVNKSKARTFGFKEKDDALEFQSQYGGKYAQYGESNVATSSS